MEEQHEAYYVRTGENEWGKTFTIYAWDSTNNIYRELVTNVSESDAKRTVKNSNKK